MKTRTKTLTFIIIFFLLSFQHPPRKDKFIGRVVAEWIGERKMKLLEDFTYVDPNGKIWKAPKNTPIDGASIPPIFWSTIGGPFEGEYRYASVVHDYYCLEPYKEKWQNVHKMFYDACITGGVSEIKAKIMYKAVYMGGPKWEVTKVNKKPGNRVVRSTKTYKYLFNKTDFDNLTKWIESSNPDIKTINDTLNKILVIDLLSIEEVEEG